MRDNIMIDIFRYYILIAQSQSYSQVFKNTKVQYFFVCCSYMDYLRNARVTDSLLLMTVHISTTSLTIGQIVIGRHKSTESPEIIGLISLRFYRREHDQNGSLGRCCRNVLLKAIILSIALFAGG